MNDRCTPRLSGPRDTLVWRFPTSGVVMWSPIRKASEYTRFLASVPSLGHLIAETVSSLASGHQVPRA
jgi:hypothetical protein